MDQFLEFVGKAEGRDKFGKLIQFIARFWCDVARKGLGQEEFGQQCEFFWRQMLDARRMQWFGKSFAEWKTVMTTLDNKSLQPEVRVLHAAARFLFCIRWAIENVMILYKIKALTGRKWQDLNRTAKRVWSAAIICGIATEICKMKRHLENSDSAGQKKAAITIVQHCGDACVPLVIGYDVPLSDGVVGFGHAVAASIQSYNLWPAAKKKDT